MIQKTITVSEKLSLSVKMAVKNLEIFDCNLSLISGQKNIFFCQECSIRSSIDSIYKSFCIISYYT